MGHASAGVAFWSLALATLCAAAPPHDLAMHATDAVRTAHAEMRAWVAGGGTAGAGRRRLAQGGGDGVDCGAPPAEGGPRDPMFFTQAGCSVSSMDGYAYIDSDGTFRNASKGDLIQVRMQAGYPEVEGAASPSLSP